jgi:hypothetical protein
MASQFIKLHDNLHGMSVWKRYGFAWVTLVVFVLSLAGHWWLGWAAFSNEQRSHNAAANFSEYVFVAGRDTLENWQSEFLQLLWQVAGLAYLYYVGSPQSREGSERLEAKVDAILNAMEKPNTSPSRSTRNTENHPANRQK